jgi:hypothetical protein
VAYFKIFSTHFEGLKKTVKHFSKHNWCCSWDSNDSNRVSPEYSALFKLCECVSEAQNSSVKYLFSSAKIFAYIILSNF